MTKARIREFLREFCDEVYDMPDHALELVMYDHKCIRWHGQEYFVPEDCSAYSTEDDDIYEHLVYKFGL